VTTQLTDVLQTYREGQCPVCIQYISSTEVTRLKLGDEWKVQPSDELLNRLQSLFSEEQIRMVY